MVHLLKRLDEFNAFFKGGSSKNLKQAMRFYDRDPDPLQDFYQTLIFSNSDVEQRIKLIADTLNITKEWNVLAGHRPADLTVYDFLTQLAQQGFSQADYIIDRIDKKTRLSKLNLTVGGISIAAVILPLLATPAAHFIVALIHAFFSSMLAIPIIGLLYHSSTGIYNFISTVINRKLTPFNRFRDNFFLVLGTGAKIIACILLIAAADVMSPMIASIFVFGAGIGVIKEIFSLGQEYIDYVLHPPQNDNGVWDKCAEARRHAGTQKRVYSLGIDLVASLGLVGIMAAWVFGPGGMAITIMAVTAIIVVQFIKHAYHKRSDAGVRENLQATLTEIVETHEKSAANELIQENTLSATHTTSASEPASSAVPLADNAPRPRPSRVQDPSASNLPFFQQQSGSNGGVPLSNDPSPNISL